MQFGCLQCAKMEDSILLVSIVDDINVYVLVDSREEGLLYGSCIGLPRPQLMITKIIGPCTHKTLL